MARLAVLFVLSAARRLVLIFVNSLYTQVLGMEEVSFGSDRKALLFGSQKINLHGRGAEIQPNAQHAACGTADLCLLTDTPPETVLQELSAHGIKPLSGIAARTGAMGKIQSVYLRNPDGNLLEISSY
ncbi:VOC family protein [Neisseria meningitidis]|nr:VOC family protein [Neisseria meningitidis]MBH2014604.1 VOC family protein [Neisseria meningitidis]MBH2022575.1 VOC family protein [Neisseria meningitidis]MBH2026741.1 VOC family protein [Neisseria meningitidis]MBH2028595.1 VOC family protein [Neisseria meningitidis]